MMDRFEFLQLLMVAPAIRSAEWASPRFPHADGRLDRAQAGYVVLHAVDVCRLRLADGKGVADPRGRQLPYPDAAVLQRFHRGIQMKYNRWLAQPQGLRLFEGETFV